MSRVGKKPIAISQGVTVSLNGQKMTVKSAKGQLEFNIDKKVKVEVKGQEIVCSLLEHDSNHDAAMFGMVRNTIANMVEGVSNGFKKELDIVGVGYKANVKGQELELALGFSHPVVFKIPQGIKISVEKQTHLLIEGVDKTLVGETAAKIRRYRQPEPYKGKGVKYSDERIIRKAGKAGAGAKT